MFNRPQPNPTTPIPILIAATVELYVRTFRPLFVMAAVIAFIPALMGLLIQPGTVAPSFLWSVVRAGVEIAGYSAVLWRADVLQRGGEHAGAGTTVSRAIGAAIVFGPRYFAGTFALGALIGIALTPVTFLLLPFAVFVLVRLSLYWPAVVLEKRSVSGAFARSWRLVAGRWLRTFAFEFVFAAPILGVVTLITVVVVQAGVPSLGLLVVNVLISAFVVPLLSIMVMVVFEDYASASEQAPVRPLEGGPPTDDTPR